MFTSQHSEVKFAIEIFERNQMQQKMPTKIPPSKKGGKNDDEVEENKNESSEGGKLRVRSDSDESSVVEGTQLAEEIKKYRYNGKKPTADHMKMMENLAGPELREAGTQFNVEDLVNHYSRRLVKLKVNFGEPIEPTTVMEQVCWEYMGKNEPWPMDDDGEVQEGSNTKDKEEDSLSTVLPESSEPAEEGILRRDAFRRMRRDDEDAHGDDDGNDNSSQDGNDGEGRDGREEEEEEEEERDGNDDDSEVGIAEEQLGSLHVEGGVSDITADAAEVEAPTAMATAEMTGEVYLYLNSECEFNQDICRMVLQDIPDWEENFELILENDRQAVAEYCGYYPYPLKFVSNVNLDCHPVFIMVQKAQSDCGYCIKFIKR